MPNKKLIVIGDGPDFAKIKAKAKSNIILLGYQPSDLLRKYMQEAKAFVFAAEEDFGITPVEAQSCGTPVIAFGKGGALETVRGLGKDKPTGVFFNEQNVQSLINAVQIFEDNMKEFSPISCSENAKRFSNERFRQELSDFINNYINKNK